MKSSASTEEHTALHWRGPGSSWHSLPGLSAFFEASRPLWTCLLGGLFDDWRGTGVEALRVGACGPPPSLSMPGGFLSNLE